MLSCEGTGKNIEQAINNALLELKASREDVDIKILEEGGFFKKAKVVVSISEDALGKYQKREEIKKQEEVEEKKAVVKKADEPVFTKEQDVEEPVDHIVSNKQEEKLPDVDKAKNFISGLLERINVNADIMSEENKDEVFLTLIGASEIIGFRGEGLNAIQYLSNVYVAKNNRHCKKIRVDCDNYRAKREDTLIALANRMARKVAKTNHAIKLEPMTANERRIIHSALANDRFVETISKGEEPYRYLTILPKSKLHEHIKKEEPKPEEANPEDTNNE